MLDRIILTVSNVDRSLAFYEAALKPLHINFFLPYKGEGDHPDLWRFGNGKRAFFWLKQGKPDPTSIHWGFMVENNDKVDAFYAAAIAAGGTDNISPRARVEYYPGYYAADVIDPDGVFVRGRPQKLGMGPRVNTTCCLRIILVLINVSLGS